MAVLTSPHYNFVIMKTKVPICGRDIWIIWMTRSSHMQKWGEGHSWHHESRQPLVPLMIWRKVCVYVSNTREKSTHVLSRFSRVQLFATSWTVALQSPLSMGFPRQEYWSGLSFFPRGSSQPRDRTWVSCIAGRFFTIWATRQAPTRQASGGQIMKDLEEHNKEFRIDSKRARSPWQV